MTHDTTRHNRSGAARAADLETWHERPGSGPGRAPGADAAARLGGRGPLGEAARRPLRPGGLRPRAFSEGGGMAASALGVAAAGAARRRAAGHRLVALPACGGHWLKALAPSGGPASASTSRPRRRSFSSGPLDDDAPGVAPGRKPVDTTTPRDQQMSLRHLERRIEEHRKKGGEGTPEAEAERAGEVADGQVVPAAQGPLRIVDPDAPAANENKDVVVRSRTTTGQVLWPATEEDIAILSQSKQLYPSPLEVEGSVIIRLVRLSDPVTSPVGLLGRTWRAGTFSLAAHRAIIQ